MSQLQLEKYDIAVIGGGFAGVAAAIAAARQGKKVILVEKYNCLGGAAAYSLVNPFMRYWTQDPISKERILLSRGIFEEILAGLAALGEDAIDAKAEKTFSEEYLKLVLNRMCIGAGVTLLFQTHLTEAECTDGRIRSVTLSNVSGRQTLCADYFIDATGDGNLAFLAGFSYHVGRAEDGRCQPMTLCFRMAGVDHALFLKTGGEINRLYRQLWREDRLRNPREDVLFFNTLKPGLLHFNTTRVVKLDPTNALDVTAAELEAREQVFELVGFLKENFDAFQNAYLVSTGIQIGVRESRMIDGEKCLTQEDLLQFCHFEDGIAACNYDIDIHSPDGAGTSHHFFPDGKYYTIPYRCLVPIGSKNLLCAGRCISATHEAQASLRIMPTCCTLGEAAGIAAAVASSTGTDVGSRSQDIRRVRQLLRDAGAVID